MTWLPVILITLTFGAFLPEANGKTSTKKSLFQNYELLDHFSEILVDQLISIGLINSVHETAVLDSLRDVIESNQGKKVSSMKHGLSSKIADIIVEELEKKGDAATYIEKAIVALETAFEETIGVVDSNFIDTVNEMVSVMYNNDLEDELEEEQDTGLTDTTQDSQQDQVLQTTELSEVEELSQTASQNEQTNAATNIQFTAESLQSTSSQNENEIQASSVSQTSSASQVESVNYQSIQSSFSSTLQSSSILTSLSSGILSSSDMTRAVESVLRSYGVQNGIVQRISNQYIASLGAGASSQTIISILSSIVTQALQQSNIVRPGQESSIGSSVAQKLIIELQAYISSRSQPAPQPLQRPRPVPRPVPAPISPIQQQTSLYSGSQQGATSQIAAQSLASQSAQSSSASQVSSVSQTSSASQVVSVNYLSIQSSFSSTLQSSSILSSLSSGILSRSDMIRAVESVLRSYGVQSGIVQSISSQYIASLGAGASSQTIVSILSSIISQALQQSDIIRPGQESSIGSSVAQKLIIELQAYISSRSRPAPQPLQRPRPVPAPVSPVQQQTSLYSGSQQSATSQIAAQSLASQSAQLTSESQSFLSQSLGTSENIDYSSSYSGSGSTDFEKDSLYNSGGISTSSGFSENASPQTSISSSMQQLPALSKASSQLMSPAATARISTLSGSLSSALAGGIDYASLSQALGNVASEIGRSSNLSQSEVLIEALLETLVALLELLSPSPSGSSSAATELAQSLIQLNA